MAVAVPMITFPQTSQPTTESEPAVAKAAVANASPTSDENSTDTDTSLKTVPLAKSSILLRTKTNSDASFWMTGRRISTAGSLSSTLSSHSLALVSLSCSAT